MMVEDLKEATSRRVVVIRLLVGRPRRRSADNSLPLPASVRVRPPLLLIDNCWGGQCRVLEQDKTNCSCIGWLLCLSQSLSGSVCMYFVKITI